MRKVTLVSPKFDTQTIETSAGTWGELKEEISETLSQFKNVKAVVGETKTTLESKGAHLPTTDFSLYIWPEKTKSGNDIASEIEAVSQMDYNAIRRYGKGKVDCTKSRADIEKSLKRWIKKNHVDTDVQAEVETSHASQEADVENSPSTDAIFETVVDMRDTINSSLDTLEEALKGFVEAVKGCHNGEAKLKEKLNELAIELGLEPA